VDDPTRGVVRVVARTTVFGRVAPEHKERIVTSLRRQGRYVAMLGDGVNDARALKAAQVGVAMRSGSAVTRDVADIVLVDDSFAALRQTGLSTFICLASFVLILFLAPPHQLFAAWTRPVTDRRPTILVAALLVAFVAILFVPTLYDYFGLTAGNSFVFGIVGVAVVLWFAALSAAYRFRLLDRILGFEHLPDPALDAGAVSR